MSFFSTIFTCLLIISLSSLPAQIFEENFDYSTGVLTSVASSVWVEDPIGSTDIQVVDLASLTYTGYPSASVGKVIKLDGGASGRSGAQRSIGSFSTAGTEIFFSFLMQVIDDLEISDNIDMDGGFANFQTSTGSSRGIAFIKNGGALNSFRLGLGKASTTGADSSNLDLAIGQTHLVVISYKFESGDDTVKLWINPDLSGATPAPDLITATGSDADGINFIHFKQRSLSGNIYIDGVRVATSWNNAPLPVELSTFGVKSTDNSVELNWTTVTEIDNYGFEVERSANDAVWKSLAFIEGTGNSNSTQKYFYLDPSPNKGINYYRLKQIDFNGNFSYSSTESVDFNAEQDFSLSPSYPNPFNPTTTAKYYINETSNVSLKLYNSLGQVVHVIHEGVKEKGSYNATIDGRYLASGIYFLRLSNGSNFIAQKLLLLK